MSKILITGSAGFLGYHLMTQLGASNDVVGIDNFMHASSAPHKNVKYGDVRYYRDIEDYIKWADEVYHLAAQIHVDKSISNPQETIDINVIGTLNVLELCRKYNKKLVFASSSEVYGTSRSKFMKETHQLDPQSPYAASKVAADRLCHSYIKTYGMNICILRNFNTFGEYQADDSYGGVIARFTRKALLGEPLEVFGSGEQERDYMFIDDCVRGYMIASKYSGVLNVGTGECVTINEVAEQIKRITKSKSPIVHVNERPGEVMRLCADISLANSLGFKPQTKFERDLRKYINWYKKEL